ncbi:hypothetical protein QBC41DRAFT_370410, partial [Cercophora samala]
MAKAKGKKGKSDSKQAKLAEKKQKQEKKADKKSKSKASKNADVDSDDDVDLDAVLEEMRQQQEQHHKITETVLDGPPPVSSYASFIANPVNSNQLLLFGGELYDGSRASFFNKLYVYYIDKDEWRSITSPNAPLPRSSHAWTRGGNDSKSIYLFGGEFSSPKQGTFYHYSDFWKLDCSTKEWTRVETKGKSPPARSGHRLTYYKQYIILFGGFQETTGDAKYLGDVWIYDTNNFVWHTPTFPPAQLKPEPRSSFTLLPHDQGAVLYGGYSRVKVNPGAGKGGGGQQQMGKKSKSGGGYTAQKLKVVGMIHTDCFFLRITPPASDAPQGALPVVRWERRKKPANAPNPPRTGAAMAFHKGRGIMFGGVYDHEETEEDVGSDFFNQLFAWNIERNRFFPLGLRKPRANAAGKKGGEQRGGGGRRGNRQANEEELLRSLAKLATGQGGDGEAMDIDLPNTDQSAEPNEPTKKEFPVSNELPHGRFNSQLAVQDDVLYIYGGIMDKGGRDVIFDDLYAIDLGKLDGCKEIFNRPLPDWIESEDEEDDDDDEDDDEYSDSGSEEEEEEDEEMEGVERNNNRKSSFTPSKRGKKKPSSVADTESTAVSTGTPSAEQQEDWEAETAAEDAEEEVVDDGLPHPRPFESRRDFFQRTSNEWQEILMTSLRWKNIQPETLSIKEIKSRAFEMSEEKWWDCREEITAMEDEQE